MSRIKKLYYRIRYWRQLKRGFGLLSDVGAKKDFTIAYDKAWIYNGVDPMTKVDLTSGVVTQFPKSKAKFNIYYIAKPKDK